MGADKPEGCFTTNKHMNKPLNLQVPQSRTVLRLQLQPWVRSSRMDAENKDMKMETWVPQIWLQKGFCCLNPTRSCSRSKHPICQESFKTEVSLGTDGHRWVFKSITVWLSTQPVIPSSWQAGSGGCCASTRVHSHENALLSSCKMYLQGLKALPELLREIKITA